MRIIRMKARVVLRPSSTRVSRVPQSRMGMKVVRPALKCRLPQSTHQPVCSTCQSMRLNTPAAPKKVPRVMRLRRAWKTTNSPFSRSRAYRKKP